MRSNGYQNYHEDEVLSADPVKLIQLLYRGATDSIAAARRHLRSGDIQARSRAISKAMAIVTELSLSLDHEKGGELSASLEVLYGYIEKLLIRANTEQSDPPLAEAERLMSTLTEAWEACMPPDANPKMPVAEPKPAQADYEPVSCAY